MRMPAIIRTAIIGSAVIIPGSAFADTMTTADLNMRAGPSTTADVIGVVPKNSDIVVGECVRYSSWCEASFDGLSGWVSSAYLSESEDAEGFPGDPEMSGAHVIPQDRDWFSSESAWPDDQVTYPAEI